MKLRYVLPLLVLLFCSIALAANVTVVTGDVARGQVNFASVDSAPIDSTSYASAPIELSNRKTIFVTAFLAAGSTTTCRVGVALGTLDPSGLFRPRAWVATGTMTADALSPFPCPGVELPTGGWTHAQIHLLVVSSGAATVTWSAY